MSFIDVPSTLPERGESSPIPAGDYAVTVFGIVAETVKSGANAGKPRWNVQFRVASGEHTNRRVFAYIPLYVAGDFWKTQAFFSALGHSIKAGEKFTLPDVNDLLGSALTVSVTIREADGQYSASNNVSGFDIEKPVDALAGIGATPVSGNPFDTF